MCLGVAEGTPSNLIPHDAEAPPAPSGQSIKRMLGAGGPSLYKKKGEKKRGAQRMG